MEIYLDFDGTVVTHEFPNIGLPVPGAIEGIKELMKNYKVILNTYRSTIDVENGSDYTQKAVNYLKDNGVDISESLKYKCMEHQGMFHGDDMIDWYDMLEEDRVYIDDITFNCPLTEMKDSHGKIAIVVDWESVMSDINHIENDKASKSKS